MRTINNIMKNTVLCFLAAMLSVSCLSEKDELSARMQGVMIQVNVAAEGIFPTSAVSSSLALPLPFFLLFTA